MQDTIAYAIGLGLNDEVKNLIKVSEQKFIDSKIYYKIKDDN